MKEKDLYTWNAEDYARHSSAQQAWARELIPKLKLNGYESVLDIGCGDGKITAEIAEHLPNGLVVGVDSSNDMIKLACKHFLPDEHSNLRFQLADANELLFEEKFDIVFSNAALHWIRDHQHVISGIQKSLKLNGRILLQMGGKGNAQSVVSVLETMLSEKEWISFFSDFEFPYGFHAPEHYKSLLIDSGLNPIRVELISKDMSYKKKEALVGWIRTTWLPYTNRVPVHMREDFVAQLVDRYIEAYPPDGEGNVHIKMIRLEVEAKKIR